MAQESEVLWGTEPQEMPSRTAEAPLPQHNSIAVLIPTPSSSCRAPWAHLSILLMSLKTQTHPKEKIKTHTKGLASFSSIPLPSPKWICCFKEAYSSPPSAHSLTAHLPALAPPLEMSPALFPISPTSGSTPHSSHHPL